MHICGSRLTRATPASKQQCNCCGVRAYAFICTMPWCAPKPTRCAVRARGNSAKRIFNFHKCAQSANNILALGFAVVEISTTMPPEEA
jgi:hypothetical protein